MSLKERTSEISASMGLGAKSGEKDLPVRNEN
jgi:hypothetical protein